MDNITYIPMGRGFVYLAAVMDWFSRLEALAWRVSITVDTPSVWRWLKKPRALWCTRYLQYGSGKSAHKRGFHRPAEKGWLRKTEQWDKRNRCLSHIASLQLAHG